MESKERILDIVLTDKGRELMSKNQLNFVYYAFSDEGIDYGGSLSSSVIVSSSLDNYVHRNLSFEADQRKNKDLQTFLYTVPGGSKVLPEFKSSTTGSIDLERRFYIDTIILKKKGVGFLQPPIDVVVKATVPKKTLQDRISEYVFGQKTKLFLKVGKFF